MQSKFFTMIITAVLALSMALPETVLAAQTQDVSLFAPDTAVTLIVEVEGDATLAASAANALGAKAYLATDAAEKSKEAALSMQADVLEEIRTDVVPAAEKGFTYTTLFNGFSIDATYQDIEKIESLPGVKNVYISYEHEVPELFMTDAVDMGSIPAVWEDSAFRGEGQVIAIIDSEFDTTHEFFQTAPENPRLSKEDILSLFPEEGDENDVEKTGTRVYKSEKIPFAYDYYYHSGDTIKRSTDKAHGTHVAGIAAGKNGTAADGSTFSGVAPEAQLLLMKISSSSGGIPDALAVAAMDDAAKMGANAINMSFGTDYMPVEKGSVYVEPIANARNAGILVNASSGNSSRGYQESMIPTQYIDYGAAGTPGIFSGATSVASADNLVKTTPSGTLKLSGGNEVTYNLAWSDSEFYTALADSEQEYVYCGYGRAEDFAGINVTGKVALVRRGENTFAEKADNAAAAGAAALIIWNNKRSAMQTTALSLPACAVMPAAGEQLLGAETKTFTVTSPQTRVTISGFSSWGATGSLEIKPDLTAPGGMIYSSYASVSNPYATYSGTSMATPYLCGVTALMSQYIEQSQPTLTGIEKAETIESLLMSTATVITQANGIPESPRRQGAGLANAQAATETPAVLLGKTGETKLNLGYDSENTFTLEFRVRNFSAQPVTYNIAGVDVLTDNYMEINGVDSITDMRRLPAEYSAPETVTVAANGETAVSIQVTVSEDVLLENAAHFPNGFFIDGYVYLKSADSQLPELHIPYSKFHGDWKSVPYFDATRYDGNSVLYLADNPSTGTYLYAAYNSLKRPLGQYRLADTGTSADFEQEILDKKYIALSPNGDGMFDTLEVAAQPLRNVNTQISVLDADGEACLNYTPFVLCKFYTNALKLPHVSDLPAGDYQLVFSGVAASDTDFSNPQDSFMLPFTIDLEAPQVLCAYLSPDKNTLTVTASDNHYLQGAVAYTEETGESGGINAPFVQTEAGSTARLVLDVSGMDTDNLQVKIYDYAMNSTVCSAAAYPFGVSHTLTSYETKDGSTYVTFRIQNYTSAAVVPMLAFYNANQLVQVVSGEEALASGSTEYTFTVPGTVDADSVQLFIWDSIDKMHPLADRAVYDLTA